MAAEKKEHPADKLAFRRRVVWDCLEDGEIKEVFALGESYKQFLTTAKTEREVIAETVVQLKDNGFQLLDKVDRLKPGARVYWVNRHKALMAAVLGRKPLEEGLRIIGAHGDSPRLDLKQSPVFEEFDLTLGKTHYYGGIKKYQWLTIPLSLRGVVVKADGEKVRVNIGDQPDGPVFVITDLLPHLAKDQMNKKLGEAIPGENLNFLAGSIPLPDKEIKDRYKMALLANLHETYGITEEDLISAELELVPAGAARDVGFDSGLLGGYGQDDRVCVYTALRALRKTASPEYTAMFLVMDKEEIGSTGNTGMESAFMANAVRELVYRSYDNYSELTCRRALMNSVALSADVNAGLDPNYSEVSDKMNAARIGGGVTLSKYTGSRGKSGTNDAHGEMVARMRGVFNRAGVIWQTGELGKVDQGGGGTIAYMLAAYGMDVIDCGVPLLSMHSPFEIASKADIYMAHKGYKAFWNG